MRQYREADADNARWEGFQFRPGDIIIDAPSKSGTTWTQLLVALLVFDGPHFPRSVGEMSPWMEHCVVPVEHVHEVLAAQTHCRFIKTHTPLDGVPIRGDVRYVCVGRDPRDAAVSMIHHMSNLDRERIAELLGRPPEEPQSGTTLPAGDQTYFDRWIDNDDFPGWNVRFLAHHYGTFWDHRHDPNVALFHFDDYLDDLPGQLQRLADHLHISVSPERTRQLASEASFSAARARAAELAPGVHLELMKSPTGFFRTGTSGQWVNEMDARQVDRYRTLVAGLLVPDLDAWLHRP